MASKTGKTTREERLAAALRENLKRRKARARARMAPKPEVPEGEGAEMPASGHVRATKRG